MRCVQRRPPIPPAYNAAADALFHGAALNPCGPWRRGPMNVLSEGQGPMRSPERCGGSQSQGPLGRRIVRNGQCERSVPRVQSNTYAGCNVQRSGCTPWCSLACTVPLSLHTLPFVKGAQSSKQVHSAQGTHTRKKAHMQHMMPHTMHGEYKTCFTIESACVPCDLMAEGGRTRLTSRHPRRNLGAIACWHGRSGRLCMDRCGCARIGSAAHGCGRGGVPEWASLRLREASAFASMLAIMSD